jgi:type I restriction enzyme S subunit
MSGYYLLKNGEFAYNKSYSVGYDFGSIKRLDRYPMGALSTLYICFALKRHESDFIKSYFDSLKWYREIYMISAEGARNHGLLNVPTEEFFDTKHYLPENTDEQKKIADFLIALDRRIETQQSLVDNLKKYKRGLSDSLFAHISQSSGCKIVKLGDAFDLLQNNTFSREDLTSELSTVQNIHYGDVLIKYGAIVNIAEDKPPYIKPDIELKKYSSASYLCDGDIVFADTAEDYTVGKATEIAGANGLSVLSGLHTIPCRPLIKFQPMYLGYYFNSSLFRTQIYPLIQGTKVSSISKGELIKANVYVPTLEEQKKIALLLYSMDCRITKEERKSSDLITARKALLQQLFI